MSELLHLVRAVACEHGMQAPSIREIVGLGTVNHVFVVEDGGIRRVLRFARDDRAEPVFDKEAWCLREAAARGVPTPGGVASGIFDGVPYLLQEFVDGMPGSEVRSLEMWRTLGRYARAVHSISEFEGAPSALFQRFSRDPAAAWRMHLEYNLGELTPHDRVMGLGVYRGEDQAAIRAVFEALSERSFCFGLNHGDLALRNLLVSGDGPPVLIDWGSAAVGLVPFGDLETLYWQHLREGDPSKEEWRAFAEGYGLDLKSLVSTLGDLLLLGRIDLVRWALDRRPDRLDEIAGESRDYVARYFGSRFKS